jgi:DedD protein
MSEKKQVVTGPTQRGALLRRAGIAAVLIVALLAGLAWFERAQTESDAPALAEAPPPPPLPELPRGAPPMPTAEAVEAMVAAESGLAPGGDQASAELTAAPVVVEPEKRTDETPPAVTGAPRLVLGGDAPTPDAKPSPPPAPVSGKSAAPAGTEPAKPESALIKDGYLVQLGVFSAPGNAQALVDKVDALGIPAHIESRVVVGPFKNRAEADAARKQIAQSGLGKGMVVRGR